MTPGEEPEDPSEPGPTEPDPTERLGWDDVPALLGELHQIATRLLARWPGMQSLQPTLLMTTALRRQRRSDQSWEEVTWENRRQFFGQASRAMLQKLVEYRRHPKTRGYQAQRRVSVTELELHDASRGWTEDPAMILALEAALRDLGKEPRIAEVVHYRFFADLSEAEIAEILEVDPRTVRRDWKKARILMEESIRAWWQEESAG
jgi:DNA-directed RNA polymerase specialized sigma24 family protein